MSIVLSRKYPILETVIYLNLFFGCSAVLFYLEFLHVINHNNIDIHLATFLFFGTSFYYSFYYYDNVDLRSSARADWIRRNRFMYIFYTLICAVIGTYCLLQLLYDYWFNFVAFKAIILAVLLGILLIIYNFHPQLFLCNKWRCKKTNGILKPFIISIVWVLSCNVLPLICYYDNSLVPMHQSIVLLLLVNFLFIAVLCILFDYKDKSNDRANNSNTFVLRFEDEFCKHYVVYPLILIGFIFHCYEVIIYDFNSYRILFLMLFYIIFFWITTLTTGDRSELFFYLMIDGMMLLKPLLFGFIC